VLTTDRVQLEALASVWRGARHLPGAAAAIVLTLRQPDPERYRLMDQYDLGQATMAMALAAVDLGIGSGHSAIGDEDACRRILSIPAEQICAYMLALGYPADRPLTPIRTPDRRPLEDVVHRGGW
jgi:nitroreductase